MTDQDYKYVLDSHVAISIILEYGRARLLLQMGDFHAWEAAALWDDARALGLTHSKRSSKDRLYWRPQMGLSGGAAAAVVSGGTRSFSQGVREEASNWI